VRGESRTCSFSRSSSATRSSPQVGFSAAIRRIKRLTSAEICGRPTGFDFQRQKRRKAVRCQPIRVAGLTISKAPRQSKKLASLANTKRSVALVRFWASSRALGIRPVARAGTDFRRPARCDSAKEQHRSCYFICCIRSGTLQLCLGASGGDCGSTLSNRRSALSAKSLALPTAELPWRRAVNRDPSSR
jgi:hypothetical protein